MRLLALAVLAACGSKPPPSAWVEREAHGGKALGESHAEATAVAGAPPVAITFDPRTLTPAQIDELDEPRVRAAIDQLADAAPAARLALRGARLAPGTVLA